MNNIKALFQINPDITYLNHGGFGACPKPVFEDYQNWQRQLEYEPVKFITKYGEEALKQSKESLAQYINCQWDDLIYTQNPTTALNIVIKSLDLQPGDEILSTNHEYGALDKTWKFYCEKTGAKYVRQDISLPLKNKEQFIEEFWKGLTPNTKIVFISHLTSSTALIFPVKEICERAKELGLMTIVDGAHVPGHIPLDLQDIKADIYTGANHKWLLTPKGNSFLYTTKEWQDKLDPLVVSWGYDAEFPSGSIYQDYHQYQGTRDSAAFMTVPAAIQFFKDNNWEEHKTECRKLLQHYYHIICETLGTEPICPVNDEFLGQICSAPVNTDDPIALYNLLYDKYKIEIPVFNLDGKIFIRTSFQAYNSEKEIEILLDALRDIKATTDLIK